MAGVRAEKTFIKNTQYENTSSLSPRLNLKFRINDHVTVRGGWGITEKLPSFNVLYPLPEYRDTRVFSNTYSPNRSVYVYLRSLTRYSTTTTSAGSATATPRSASICVSAALRFRWSAISTVPNTPMN